MGGLVFFVRSLNMTARERYACLCHVCMLVGLRNGVFIE